MSVLRLFIIFSILVFISPSVVAQNYFFDWGVGTHASMISYKAVLEKKITNPYEYNLGAGLNFGKYLNNNFDLGIEGMRGKVRYPVNPTSGEAVKYTETTLYNTNFTLKYKLNNGYLLREKIFFAPFIRTGFGVNFAGTGDGVNYYLPIGLGANFNIGRQTSIVFQSTYHHDLTNNNSRPMMTHSMGLVVHFIPANIKRVKASQVREREQKYARIKKYRSKQRYVRAKQAKERFDRLKQDEAKQEFANKPTFPPVEADGELLATNTPPNFFEKPSPSIPPAQPSIASDEVEEATPSRSMPIVQPSIPEPPQPSHVEPPVVVSIGDEKPPMPKPKTRETDIPTGTALADILEENEILEYMPSKIKEKPTTITENADYCANSEALLSQIGQEILFESDQYRIRSTMARPLGKIVAILNQCESFSYVIIAHTDGDGSSDYNRTLAARRAAAIKKYLIEKGIAEKRLITVSYGAVLPVAPNTTASNKAKNRRIEFKLNQTSF